MSKKAIIKRSNSLVWSRHKFTLTEQKIMLRVLSKIKESDKDLGSYPVTRKEFKDSVAGLDTLKKVISACEKLKNKTYKVESRTRPGVFHYFGLLSGWTVDAQTINFRIDPKLKPYLIAVSEYFTEYQIEIMFSFTSRYGFKLYELLKSREDFGKISFAPDVLKELLGIEKESAAYKNYNTLKTRVLAPAVADINAHSDLKVGYTQKKSGRVLEEITFKVKPDQRRQQTVMAQAKKNEKNDESLIYTYTENGVTTDCWFAGNSFTFFKHKIFTDITAPEAKKLIKSGKIKIKNDPDDR